MLLLTGPPAAGKTRLCLDELRQCLRGGTGNTCRLLLPTSTMAEHLRNELAREGFVFSPRTVSTFGKFVADYAAELSQVSTPALELFVRDQLRKLSPGRYTSVQEFPGFRSALVRAIEEFAGAGGTTAQATATDPDFLAVWTAVQQWVAANNLHFRAVRLRQAAEQIRRGPMLGSIWIAGFFGFTPPELEIIQALSERSTLTVTMAESPGSQPALARLRSFASEERRLESTRGSTTRTLVTAPFIDGEACEVARRILIEHRGGRPFREMGVIVRSEQPAVPALRAAFDRFGIPWRSYFAPALRSDPTVQYLLAIVESALQSWDHETTLQALRMHGSPLERWGDKFEYRALEHLPSRGLDSLRVHAPEFTHHYFDELSALTSWASESAAPAVWAARFSSLPELFRPARIEDQVPFQTALLWRKQSASIEHFLAAVEQTAAALASLDRISGREFRDALETAISSISVRIVDRRRDVVHILDAVEARQWRLPVVFVCGLLEGEFPKHHTEDPILPDAVRRRLQEIGLPLRTSAERQAEEQFLFDLVLTRATEHLMLSYSLLNAKGEPNLSSFLLERAKPYQIERAVPVRPEAVRECAPEPYPAISDDALKAELAARHSVLSATKVETYASCPYNFFAARTLRLQERPAAPWDRLNGLIRGTIGHRVFEVVFRENVPVRHAFDTAFGSICEEAHVPDGYRTEAIRLELLHGIERLIRDGRLAGTGDAALLEKGFEIQLTPELRIRGTIDRLDVDEQNRAIILDYKYKRKYRIDDTVKRNESGERVQSGLYLLGARSLGYAPAGMIFAGFKNELSIGGWVLNGLRPELQSTCSQQHLEEVAAKAREVTIAAHFQILDGRIRPQPADQQTCDFCSFSTICRVESLVEVAVGTADAAQ